MSIEFPSTVVNTRTLQPLTFQLSNHTDIYDQYLADISSYVKCISENKGSDYLVIARKHFFNQLLDKWQPLLGFDATKIREDIRDIQTPKINVRTSYMLKDILNEDIPILDQIVLNLLNSVGLCIFGGQAKGGKSTFLYQLVYSIVMGKPFLGRPVKAGRVLFLQLEEPKYLIKKRLMLSGFGDLEDVDTRLIVNFSNSLRIEREFDLVNDLDWLSDIIKFWKPDIVIIDSLRKATMKSNIGENTNEMGKLVYQLQQVITHAEIAGILVHHTNKTPADTKKKDNNPNRLSGHNSLAGASDGMIFLNKEDPNDGSPAIHQIFTKPRDGVELEIHYVIDTSEGGLTEFKRVFEDTPATNPITSKIIRYLATKADTYFSAKAISRGINVKFDGDFNKCLLYLQTSNVIVNKFKDKAFYYMIKADSIWVNPVNVSSEFNTPAMLDALHVLEAKSKRELRHVVKLWEPARLTEMQKVLNPEERQVIKDLINSYEFEIGEYVMHNDAITTVLGHACERASLNRTLYLLDNVDYDVLEELISKIEPEEIFEEDPLDAYTKNEDETDSMEDILTIDIDSFIVENITVESEPKLLESSSQVEFNPIPDPTPDPTPNVEPEPVAEVKNIDLDDEDAVAIAALLNVEL